ncbi:MAG: pyridoxal phosphate-dependent aminotransferase [Hespellia sp.]|nr:pyridoxal phosphate-dependent aminotransferase [Hespellia sp.]
MYNFDKVVDRRNTGSLKWDVKDNELPMWVADMDFETAPEILECIRNRVSHGIFGYHIITEDWYGAYVNWWKKMHRFEMQKEWLIFATGVIPILSSAVRKLTTVGENVVIQTPVYNNFFNCIQNNGRNVLESPLIYEEGVYRIDFDDLEKKLADEQTTLMFLCNPHNPIGKIWNRETLQKVGELAAKHHVIVISDEIHCDLTAPGKEYVPFASVSEICRENSITCIAPTKTFNIAGIQSAAVVVPNEVLRHKMWRALNTDEVAEPNTFAIPAAVAAFEKGGAWLTELKSYLQTNKEMAEQFLKENLPELRIVSMEATYLLWIDCSRITNDSGELAEYIREKTGLYLTRGDAYGESGKTFLRWNVACPKALLIDGLARMKDGVNQYKNRL